MVTSDQTVGSCSHLTSGLIRGLHRSLSQIPKTAAARASAAVTNRTKTSDRVATPNTSAEATITKSVMPRLVSLRLLAGTNAIVSGPRVHTATIAIAKSTPRRPLPLRKKMRRPIPPRLVAKSRPCPKNKETVSLMGRGPTSWRSLTSRLRLPCASASA
jgi:hypothetical protein